MDEEIKRLSILSTVPKQYPLFVELGVLSTLVALLAHENADIASSVVDLLRELTEEDDLQEEREDAESFLLSLIDALVK